MQEFLKKAILRLFPELSGGLHVDRYAKVIAVSDPPSEGSASERFRPRLAVDIEVLDADMNPDPAFPKYTAVPLPVPLGAGGESGSFAFPERGALVVVGFAYGRQDHPIIRQIYGIGDSLPEVKPGEILQQASPTVYQRADADGNWTRATDGDIKDSSVTRHVEAMESRAEYGKEQKTVTGHSAKAVHGASSLEVGTQMSFLAGKRANVGTLGDMHLTAGAESTHTTGKNAVETVGGNHSSRVEKDRDIVIKGGRSEDVAKNQKTTIGQSRAEHIGEDQSLSVDGDMKDEVQGEKKVDVGGKHTDKAGGNRTIEAANIILRASSRLTIIGGEGVNYNQELLDCLGDIRQALDVLATHDHPDAGVINQGGQVAAEASSAEGHRQRMKGITE